MCCPRPLFVIVILVTTACFFPTWTVYCQSSSVEFNANDSRVSSSIVLNASSAVTAAYGAKKYADAYREGTKISDALRTDPNIALSIADIQGALTYIDLAVRLGDWTRGQLLPSIDRELKKLDGDTAQLKRLRATYSIVSAEIKMTKGKQDHLIASLETTENLGYEKFLADAKSAADLALSRAVAVGDPLLVARCSLIIYEIQSFNQAFVTGGVARIISRGKSLVASVRSQLDAADSSLKSEYAYLFARVVEFVRSTMVPPDASYEEQYEFGISAQKYIEGLRVPEFGQLQALRRGNAFAAAKNGNRKVVEDAIELRREFWRHYSWNPSIGSDAAMLYAQLGDTKAAVSIVLQDHAKAIRDLDPDDPKRGDSFLAQSSVAWSGLDDEIVGEAITALLDSDDLLPSTNPARRTLVNRLIQIYENSGQSERVKSLSKTLPTLPLPPKVQELLTKADRGDLGYKELEKKARSYRTERSLAAKNT